MSFITLVIISLGLSLDGLAVSLGSGLCLSRNSILFSLKMATSLGIFHFLMPLAGWYAGVEFKPVIETFDHWLAFLLLTGIGGKMIYEANSSKNEQQKKAAYNNLIILGLSFATSIDALIVGLSLAFLDIPIMKPALVFGITMFSVSIFGFLLGKKACKLSHPGIEIAGGLIIIGIGIKILISHTLT